MNSEFKELVSDKITRIENKNNWEVENLGSDKMSFISIVKQAIIEVSENIKNRKESNKLSERRGSYYQNTNQDIMKANNNANYRRF